MPREAQNPAVHRRQDEAGAEPDVIAAEAKISSREPEALVHNGEAFAQPRGPKMDQTEAVPNGHSQANVLRLVGALHRFEKHIERFVNSALRSRRLLPSDQRISTLCKGKS
jgi:hypothetical protein